MFVRAAIRGVVLLAAATIACPVHADDKSDFDAFEDKYEDLVDEYDDLDDRVTEFLEISKDIRSQDKEELNKLIKAICDADIEADDDDTMDILNGLLFDSKTRVSQFYEDIEEGGRELLEDIEEQMNDQKSTRDIYKALMDSEEVGDDARRVIDDLVDLIETTSRRHAEINDDYRSLTNIKDGVMNGTNNPLIRAKIEYGKTKHRDLQKTCDEKEVYVSGVGFADCVRFKDRECMVVEFKPDTQKDKAEPQAAKYVAGIKSKYKDDSRAKAKCENDSDDDKIFDPIFKAEGETYPACRP